MKKNSLTWPGVLIALFILTSQSYAAQQVMPVQNSRFIAPGASFSYHLRYTVAPPITDTEAGLGVRIHYNSGQLTPDNTQLFSKHAQPLGEFTEDTEDYDNDPATDRYFIAAWVDFDAQWPGSDSLPLELLETTFTTKSNLTASTAIRLSASGTAKNTPLQSKPHYICAQPQLRVNLAETIPANTVSENAKMIDFIFRASAVIPPECGNLTVAFKPDGAADIGIDYLLPEQTIQIPAGSDHAIQRIWLLDDDIPENDETLIINLEHGADYTLSEQTSATIIIKNDDTASALPIVDLALIKTDTTAADTGSIPLLIQRRGDLSKDLTVLFELEGTLQESRDYHPFPRAITIPAGQANHTVSLRLKEGAEQSTTQTLNIRIAANTNYQRGHYNTLPLTFLNGKLKPAPLLPGAHEFTHNKSIPTLSEWMLILLSMFMGLLALTHFRPGRQRT